jgi:hypothetical protein
MMVGQEITTRVHRVWLDDGRIVPTRMFSSEAETLAWLRSSLP